MKHPYVPWTMEQILLSLSFLGCTCQRGSDATISTTSFQVEGESWSFVARHSCPICRTSVKEIADPNYVMPPDVDR